MWWRHLGDRALLLRWTLQLLSLFERSPGLPLTSALPNLEWNHLIKAGSVSKMGFEHSSSGLSCRPEPPSAQRVPAWSRAATSRPCPASLSPKQLKILIFPYSGKRFWAFMDARSRRRSSHVAQLMEIAEHGQGTRGIRL